MTDPIRTKPNNGSEIGRDGEGKMIVSREYQAFFDDLEEQNNKNVESVIHPTYLVNQTPSALPEANQNVGGIIAVTGLSFLAFSALAYSATIKPGGNPPLPITNVTDVGGIAQFNHIVGTLELAREVVIFNYVTNPTYNGTFKISISGNGFFRINSIAFTGSETVGKFIFGSDWRLLNSFTHIIVI